MPCVSLAVTELWKSVSPLFYLRQSPSNLHVFVSNTGMDAQVAYGFHHLRNDKPYLAQGPISNKVGFIIFPNV